MSQFNTTRMTDVDRHVARRLGELRRLRGLTMAEAGQLVGCSYQQWFKREQGVNLLTAGQLALSAAALKVSVADLFPAPEPDVVPAPAAMTR